MKKSIKGLMVIVFAIAMAGCSNNSSLAETRDWGVDDLKSLIERTYENISEGLPMSETIEITDNERITAQIGLQDLSDVESVVMSNALMMTIPYSFILIQTSENANIDAMKQEIYDNINMRFWICVAAEKAHITSFGSVIMVIMADTELADKVYAEFDRVTEGDLGRKRTVINDEEGIDGDFGLDLGPDFELDGETVLD